MFCVCIVYKCFLVCVCVLYISVCFCVCVVRVFVLSFVITDEDVLVMFTRKGDK